MRKPRTTRATRLRSFTDPGKDMMNMHVESMARHALGDHPMLAKLQPKIRRAVLGAVKGVKSATMKRM